MASLSLSLSMTADPLMLTMHRLFESGILADVEVKCGGHTWKLHKTILCTRSIWFKKALTGSFKVRSPWP